MEVENEVDEKYICPICCDVLKLPVMTPCGHLFCTECLDESITRNGDKCPVCRGKIEWRKCKKHKKLEKEIETIKITCIHCKTQVALVLYVNHTSSCSKAPPRSLVPHHFKPVASTSQATPSPGPNRATFQCPICKLPNLDSAGLRDHCNDKHSAEKKRVVCPICAAMPWGDTSQVSADFISHLNLRHKFEYDTFVDYQQDEDVALEAALQASLQNQ